MDYTTRSSRLDSDTGTEPEIRSERERWKSHHLYKSNTKLKLEAMCRDLRISVALEKHQLVNLIYNYHEETLPDPFLSLYSGELYNILPATAGIKQLTVPNLRSILQYHNLPPYGPKD